MTNEAKRKLAELIKDESKSLEEIIVAGMIEELESDPEFIKARELDRLALLYGDGTSEPRGLIHAKR